MEKKVIKKRRRNTKKNGKFSWKMFCIFLVFMVVFTTLTAPFVLLYGPFEQAKRTYVGSAMGTMTHQWLATMFLSDEKINEILGKNDETEVADEEVNKQLVKLPAVADETITLTQLNGTKFIGYVLTVNDPRRVKVGVSSQLGKMGETTSEIAENNDAVAAINGGAFTDGTGEEQWTANGGIPSGILISEGVDKNYSKDAGANFVAAIDKEGRLIVGEYTYDQLMELGVTDALSFALPQLDGSLRSPVLIQNGKARQINGDGGLGTAPKTMIGQRRNGEIVLVVLNSKIPAVSRVVATIKEAQEVMEDLDCVTAMLLDGGKSTTMYYDGEVVNEPSNTAGERPIASAFIVK